MPNVAVISRLRFAVLGSFALTVASCGDSSGPNGSGRASLQIVSGSQASDTVQAKPALPLIVEVRDSTGAKARQGTAVTFTGVATTINTGMLVGTITATEYLPSVIAQTDADGRASVSVQYGTLAGAARVAISVPSLALLDTARYTILPGNGTQLSALPLDTAIYAGRTYTLRGAVVDRFSNVRTDPVTYAAASPGLSVSATGVVTAQALGRYTLRASAASIAETATRSVSVVPQGTLTATRGTRIIRVDLDGSNYRELALASITRPADPKWIPGTNTIVYSSSNGTHQVLQTVDENGVVAPFIKNPAADLSDQMFAAPARNGSVVYFGASDSRCGNANTYCLHRAASDGSNLERLASSALIQSNSGLSSSPDGTKATFLRVAVFVFDYASKTTSQLNIDWAAYWSPTWSPDGSKLAYVGLDNASLRVANADGTNSRRIDPNTTFYASQPVSWSADSRWVLGKSFFGSLQLVEVATGMVLPLGYAGGYGPGDLK